MAPVTASFASQVCCPTGLSGAESAGLLHPQITQGCRTVGSGLLAGTLPRCLAGLAGLSSFGMGGCRAAAPRRFAPLPGMACSLAALQVRAQGRRYAGVGRFAGG